MGYIYTPLLTVQSSEHMHMHIHVHSGHYLLYSALNGHMSHQYNSTCSGTVSEIHVATLDVPSDMREAILEATSIPLMLMLQA